MQACDLPRFEPSPVTSTVDSTTVQTSASTSTSAVQVEPTGVDFWVYSRCDEAYFAIGPAHANPAKRIAVEQLDFFHLDRGSGFRTSAPEGGRVWLLATKEKVIAKAVVSKRLATVTAVGNPACESLVIKLGTAR